jgi:uncharacterized protein YndB with AHSA1/START domain
MGRLHPAGRIAVTVPASPESIWAVISDPARIGEWSHETRAGRWLAPHQTAVPGARFTGTNRIGALRWTLHNEIISAEAPVELVWRTVPSRLYPDSTRWRITLEADGAGTHITQEFEILRLKPVLDRIFWRLLPAHRDRGPALAEDLRRLGHVAAGLGRPSDPTIQPAHPTKE